MKAAFLFGVCLTVLYLKQVGASCSVPLPKHVLSRRTFDRKILNKVLTHYYILDEGENLNLPLHSKVRFTIDQFNPEDYSVSVLGREPDDFTNGTCTTLLPFDLPAASCKSAIVTNRQLTATQFYISSFPEEYMIMFGCTNVNRRLNCCDGNYYVIIVGHEDCPDGFRWNAVNEDLKKNLDLEINDPRMKFVRKLIECPNDPPE